MTEEDKRRYDALQALSDHAWEEFQHKARAEWQLSLGLWAALLASAGAILAAKDLTVTIKMILGAAGLVSALVVLHLRFLLWIQRTLGDGRQHLQEAHDQMLQLLNLPSIQRAARCKGWKQQSLQVQIGITLLVGLALLMVLSSRAR